MTEKYYKVSHHDIKELLHYSMFTMAAEEDIETGLEALQKWAENADQFIEDNFEEIE